MLQAKLAEPGASNSVNPLKKPAANATIREKKSSFTKIRPEKRNLLLHMIKSQFRSMIWGMRHAFLPHERLLNWKINSFPIVRKYRLEIPCRLSEIQSALLRSKCWQAKHIRTSSVKCDTWPKIFCFWREYRRLALAFCIFLSVKAGLDVICS